jgi:hypothetical protein
VKYLTVTYFCETHTGSSKLSPFREMTAIGENSRPASEFFAHANFWDSSVRCPAPMKGGAALGSGWTSALGHHWGARRQADQIEDGL